MLPLILKILWATFPFTGTFFVLVAFWWPRENTPWGRIAAMSFAIGILMICYAGSAEYVFEQIHAMAIPA